MGAEHPSPPRESVMWTRGRVYAWTRGRVNRPIYLFIFFLDKSRKLSKIVSVLQSASVERFDVSRMRDFFSSAIVFSCHQAISTQFSSQNLVLLLKNCDLKSPFRLAPPAGQYPPASLEQSFSPGSPSAVHDCVCSLKRPAVC